MCIQEDFLIIMSKQCLMSPWFKKKCSIAYKVYCQKKCLYTFETFVVLHLAVLCLALYLMKVVGLGEDLMQIHQNYGRKNGLNYVAQAIYSLENR